MATPLKIVGKRHYFISLKIPCSVKRGEQVSLLVTFFNYHDKDFFSIAVDHKLALIGRTKVPGSDVRSVAVPIIPKKIKEIEVKVSSFLQVKNSHSA